MRTTTAKIVPIGVAKPFEWKNIHQVTSILQREIIEATIRGVKLKIIARKCNIRCTKTIARIGYGETKSPRVMTCLSLLHYFGYTVVVHPPTR